MSQPPRPPEMTVRHRRRPGPWLWLAVLLIPLVLAVFSWLMRDSDSEQIRPGMSPAATQPADAATEQAAQGEPVHVGGDAQTVTVSSLVPDDASRVALLDIVNEGAGDAQVVDDVDVQDGVGVTEAGGLATLLPVVMDAYQAFDIRVEDDAVTITGTAQNAQDVQAAQEAAESAFPGREIRAEGPGDATAAEATLACPDLETQIQQRLEVNPVNFELESAAIDQASQERLTEIARSLVECDSSGIRVQGHTDATGPDALNVALAQERAEAVRTVLVEAGVPADEVSAEGFADEANVAPNTGPTGREANRRVEILIEGGEQ